MRIALTGGAGFIGTHLALYLRNRGHEPLILDNLSRTLPGNLLLLRREGIPIFKRDIRRRFEDVLRERHIESLVHLAALTSVGESFRRPRQYQSINVAGTLEVILSCKSAQIKQVVNISSAAVYGNAPNCPVSEATEPRPLSPYGASKVAAEAYTRAFGSADLPTASLRLFNVYGLGQNSNYSGVIEVFVHRALSSRDLIIFGGGNQTRDFVHVDDVASAIETVLQSRYSGVLNVGSGTPTSINTLAKIVRGLAKSDSVIRHSPPRPGDVEDSWASVRGLRKLNWRGRISLEAGLKDMISQVSRPADHSS
jgi:UDP-glucose 4-epimerase